MAVPNNMALPNDNGALEIAKDIFTREYDNVDDFRWITVSPGEDNTLSVVWHSSIHGAAGQELIFWRTHITSPVQVAMTLQYPAILKYLKAKTVLPVPRFFRAEETAENPLQCPYIAMAGTPAGTTLDQVVEKFDVEQRSDLAQSIGSLLGSLVRRSTEDDKAGNMLYQRNSDLGHLIPCHFRPFTNMSDPRLTTTDFSVYQPDGVYIWMKEAFLGLKAYLITQPVPEIVTAARMILIDKLLKMAQEMSGGGWLMACRFTYVDQSLISPRNWTVISDKPEDPSGVKITRFTPAPTGCLAPSFIGCRPPTWVWGDDMDPSLMEHHDHEADLMGWQKRIKRCFDEAAGAKYQRYAYHPVYILARRLGWFAIKGYAVFPGNEHTELKEVKMLLQNWEIIRPHYPRAPLEDRGWTKVIVEEEDDVEIPAAVYRWSSTAVMAKSE